MHSCIRFYLPLYNIVECVVSLVCIGNILVPRPHPKEEKKKTWEHWSIFFDLEHHHVTACAVIHVQIITLLLSPVELRIVANVPLHACLVVSGNELHVQSIENHCYMYVSLYHTFYICGHTD